MCIRDRYGLAYAQFAAEIVLSVAAVIVLRKLFKRLYAERAEKEQEKEHRQQ